MEGTVRGREGGREGEKERERQSETGCKREKLQIAVKFTSCNDH